MSSVATFLTEAGRSTARRSKCCEKAPLQKAEKELAGVHYDHCFLAPPVSFSLCITFPSSQSKFSGGFDSPTPCSFCIAASGKGPAAGYCSIQKDKNPEEETSGGDGGGSGRWLYLGHRFLGLSRHGVSVPLTPSEYRPTKVASRPGRGEETACSNKNRRFPTAFH